MIWTVIAALLPVFGLIGVGFICGRLHVLGDRAFEVLNRFVIAVTLPILTFRSLAHMDPRNLAQPSMLAAVLVGALATYGIAYLMEHRSGRTMGEANVAALGACFSNTGFIGLPIAVLVFGQQSLPPVTVAMLIYATIVFAVGVVMTEVAAGNGQGALTGLRLAVRSMLRNPLIMMSTAGVAWAVLGLPLSGPIDTLLETLAQATAPCALVATGIFISLPREHVTAGPLVRVIVLKLIGHPLITVGVILLLPPMPPLWAKIAVLMAAMPSGASSFVLAGKAGRWAMELSAWAIMLSTVVASFSLVGVLWLIST